MTKPELLCEQITFALFLSELIYAYSYLRELARNEQLNGDSNEKILNLPISSIDLAYVFDNNPQLSNLLKGQNEADDLQVSAVNELKEKSIKAVAAAKKAAETAGKQTANAVESTATTVAETILPPIGKNNIRSDDGNDGKGEKGQEEEEEESTEGIEITASAHLQDEIRKEMKAKERQSLAALNNFQHSQQQQVPAAVGSKLLIFSDQSTKGYREQTEMVFGIGINDIEKRISVVFRGSRTPSDWVQNKKFHGIQIKNPLHNLKSESIDILDQSVYVHKGFYEYLHMKDGSSSDGGIMEQLCSVVKSHPTYEIWVTGHSLGGGLSSIFAIELSSKTTFGDKDKTPVPKPINCITLAQPLIGDIRLYKCVQTLEQTKNLYLLRVRNHEDGVTQVPGFSPIPSFSYIHVGWEMALFDSHDSKYANKHDKRKLQIRRRPPSVIVKTFSNFKQMIRLFVLRLGKDKQARSHNLKEYFRRLELYKELIDNLSSNNSDNDNDKITTLEDLCTKLDSTKQVVLKK